MNENKKFLILAYIVLIPIEIKRLLERLASGVIRSHKSETNFPLSINHKKSNMKKVLIIYFTAALFSIMSCSKDENQSSLADKVIGTYRGTTYYGNTQLPCISVITKTAETTVELTMTINGSGFSLGNIAVTYAGKNSYTLYYSDQSGYIEGKVDGNTLNYNINRGVQNSTFTGTR